MMNLNVFHNLKSTYPKWALWKKTKLFFRALKMAYQRVTRGYCDWDTMDLDFYYRQLLIDGLTHFKENLHSAPYDFNSFEGKHEKKEHSDDFLMWQEYIGDIIYCLQMSDEEYEFGLKNKYEEEYFRLLLGGENVPKELAETYWEEELKLKSRRHEYLEDGFHMLARYFEHLWD